MNTTAPTTYRRRLLIGGATALIAVGGTAGGVAYAAAVDYSGSSGFAVVVDSNGQAIDGSCDHAGGLR
jgi:hypothetical protein